MQGDYSETIIKCPSCGMIQKAVVEHKHYPWDIYVHECVECDWIITESDWEEVITMGRQAQASEPARTGVESELARAYQAAKDKVDRKAVDMRVALISTFNDWQQVRSRGDCVEINALLELSLKAVELARFLADKRHV